MKPENITGLRYRHKDLYHDSVNELPDGWVEIIQSFLLQLEDIGDLNPSVSVRFERGRDGLRAFCFPEMQVWDVHQYASLRAVQRALYHQSQRTCTVCGKPGELFMGSAIKGGSDDILCFEHADEILNDISQRRTFTTRLNAINPPVGGWPLDYPDSLTTVIQTALREINRVAVEYHIERLVTVTKLRVEDDTLFFRVKFEPNVPLGAQEEISDLARFAESAADHIWQRGGNDD